MPIVNPTPPTTPPALPQRAERATFSARVDAGFTWFVTLISEAYSLATNTYSNAVDAFSSANRAASSASSAATQAANAAISALAAETTANATAWVNGNTYAQNANVISQLDFFTYRKITALSVTIVDPKNDPANWVPLVSGSKIVRSPRTSNVILSATDRGNLIDFTGTFTQTFTAAATLTNGWFCYLRNAGTGIITLEPDGAELIGGKASIPLAPNDLLTVSCNGAGFDFTRVEDIKAGSIVTTGCALAAPAWLQCNGAAFSDVTYPDLAAAIPTHYPNAPITAPSTLVSAPYQTMSYSLDGTYFASVQGNSPYIEIFKRVGDVYTELAAPANLPTGASAGCSFSDDGMYLAVGHAVSPFVTIYKRTGDTFAKLANPTTLPAGTVNTCVFSNDGIYLALGVASSPYVQVLKRTGDVFDMLANPASAMASNSSNVSVSGDGVYMVQATITSPYIATWKRSGDTFTPTSAPALGVAPSGVNYVRVSKDGNHFSIGVNTGTYHYLYKRSGDTFAAYGVSSYSSVQYGDSAAFSRDGRFLVLRDINGFRIFSIGETALTLLQTITGLGRGFATEFSPDGKHLITGDAGGSPHVKLYGGANKVPDMPADTLGLVKTYIRTGL